MNKYQKMSRKEFDACFWDLSQETSDLIWQLMHENPITNTSLDIVDYSSECSMCGKPMSPRYCGMCTHCEMVWNS